MTPSAAELTVLSAHEWIHAFEQDTAEHEVYVPSDSAVPPARRPRQRLQLNGDHSARVAVGGADDRSRAVAARWSLEDDAVVVEPEDRGHAGAARFTYRIVSISAERLLVRSS